MTSVIPSPYFFISYIQIFSAQSDGRITKRINIKNGAELGDYKIFELIDRVLI